MITLTLDKFFHLKIINIFKRRLRQFIRSGMPSYKMKCVVLGDSRIDTWGLLAPYIQGAFNNRYKDTIGCDIGVIDIQLPWEHVIFSIWDITSKKQFQFFRHTFYRGAQCALLFFDLTQSNSFNPTLISLITEIYSTQGTIPIILIGCNADKMDQRQINQDEIDALRARMGPAAYFEIGLNTAVFPEVFEYLAEFAFNDIGLSEEKRQKDYEWQQRRLENLTEILEQMGYQLKENSEIEILNHHGLFSVNLNQRRVFFSPLICGTCKNTTCESSLPPNRASLCIVSGSEGWSNLELPNDDLLLLAKIFAITEDQLPDHVLDQMRKVEQCSHYIIDDNSSIVFDNSDYLEAPSIEIPEENLESHIPEIETHPQIAAEKSYFLQDLFENISPSEARTLLRNYHIQFNEGHLPYSLLQILKYKCEKIIFA